MKPQVKRYGVIAKFANSLLVRYHHKDEELANQMINYCKNYNLPCTQSRTYKGAIDLEIICNLHHIGDLKRLTIKKQIVRLENKLTDLNHYYR